VYRHQPAGRLGQGLIEQTAAGTATVHPAYQRSTRYLRPGQRYSVTRAGDLSGQTGTGKVAA
jgi:hypothetical protein